MIKIKLLISLFIIFCLSGTVSFAETDRSNHNVRIQVPSTLQIDSDENHIDLIFSDDEEGAETDQRTIVYRVLSNGMTQGDGAAAITAELDQTFPGIDLNVNVGTFSDQGGTTELTAASSGFVTISEVSTPLANKANSSGSGKILKGELPMTYRARATRELTSGAYSRQLTITLTDV